MVKLNSLMNNLNVVYLDNERKQLFFSYETLIAFRVNGKLYISENVWSNTTGKHLNYINPDKKIRISNDEFEQAAKTIL